MVPPSLHHNIFPLLPHLQFLFPIQTIFLGLKLINFSLVSLFPPSQTPWSLALLASLLLEPFGLLLRRCFPLSLMHVWCILAINWSLSKRAISLLLIFTKKPSNIQICLLLLANPFLIMISSSTFLVVFQPNMTLLSLPLTHGLPIFQLMNSMGTCSATSSALSNMRWPLIWASPLLTLLPNRLETHPVVTSIQPLQTMAFTSVIVGVTQPHVVAPIGVLQITSPTTPYMALALSTKFVSRLAILHPLASINLNKIFKPPMVLLLRHTLLPLHQSLIKYGIPIQVPRTTWLLTCII